MTHRLRTTDLCCFIGQNMEGKVFREHASSMHTQKALRGNLRPFSYKVQKVGNLGKNYFLADNMQDGGQQREFLSCNINLRTDLPAPSAQKSKGLYVLKSVTINAANQTLIYTPIIEKTGTDRCLFLPCLCIQNSQWLTLT